MPIPAPSGSNGSGIVSKAIQQLAGDDATNPSPEGATSISPGQASAPPWVSGKEAICPEGAASQIAINLAAFPSDPIVLGLPHRKPFLFLDRVTSLTPGEEAHGEMTFSPDDPIFLGHFPGNPIVPGVILTEALAQLAGIAGAGVEGRKFLLSAIRSMKFPAAARPGDRILLEARKMGGLGGLAQFETAACVAECAVAAGQIVLSEPSYPQ